MAGAWAKRRYPRHFVEKLTDADAEQLETRHWLGVAIDCGRLSSGEADDAFRQLESIGRRLNVMMQKAEKREERKDAIRLLVVDPTRRSRMGSNSTSPWCAGLHASA